MATGPKTKVVEYPTGDGKPMAETPIHRRNLADSIAVLEEWYADDPNVYVSGNMMMYYVPGDKRRHVSPDVFVVLGIRKLPERKYYLVWDEGKGPDVVIEMTSKSTKAEDLKKKFALYRDTLLVPEYFLFDPFAEYLFPSLQGFELVGGEYVRIEAVAGRLPSRLLRLHLDGRGYMLRFYDPATNQIRLTPQEQASQYQQQATRYAEEAAHAARYQELASQYQQEAARNAAGLQQAQAENERLRRQLEKGPGSS